MSRGLLEHQVVVVTGGVSGIGAGIVESMAAEGAQVVIWDIRPPLEGEVPEAVRTAEMIECDVADLSSIESAYQATVGAYSRVDTLVNNAGVTRDHLVRDMTLEEWELVLTVNLRGPFLTTKVVTPGMVEQRSGSIVNISSLGAKVGTVGQANYCASKAGLVGLTKSTAKEFARYSIRVNAIQPGLIDTPMTRSLRPEIYEMKLKEVPLRRAGTPGDIGAGCVFLASSMSSYMTGNVLEIGGGRYM